MIHRFLPALLLLLLGSASYAMETEKKEVAPAVEVLNQANAGITSSPEQTAAVGTQQVADTLPPQSHKAGQDQEDYWKKARLHAEKAWQESKKASGQAWLATKKDSKELWNKTREVSEKAWQTTKETVHKGARYITENTAGDTAVDEQTQQK